MQKNRADHQDLLCCFYLSDALIEALELEKNSRTLVLRYGEKLFILGEYRVIVIVRYDLADLIVRKAEHHKLSAAYDILHRGILPILAGPGVLCFGAAAECDFRSKLAGD